MTDLMGGHIAVTSTALTSAAGTILGGKVRPLAVTSRKRVADFPDIPTFAEQGFPALVGEVWFALSGPRGIPANIVRRLHAPQAEGLQQPAARQRQSREG